MLQQVSVRDLALSPLVLCEQHHSASALEAGVRQLLANIFAQSMPIFGQYYGEDKER